MKAPSFVPGDPIRIRDGLLKSRKGVVVRKASWPWSDAIPQYEVDVEGVALLRTIRADYLERAP